MRLRRRPIPNPGHEVVATVNALLTVGPSLNARDGRASAALRFWCDAIMQIADRRSAPNGRSDQNRPPTERSLC